MVMRLFLVLCFSVCLTAGEGAPDGMSVLKRMEGSWQASHFVWDQDGSLQKLGTNEARFQHFLQGKLIQEQIQVMMPDQTIPMVNMFSFDPFRGVYRLAATDIGGLMDIYEGRLEGKRLVMDNLRAGTFWQGGDGKSLAFRLTYDFSGDEGWVLDVEMSGDKGEHWQPMGRVVFARSAS